MKDNIVLIGFMGSGKTSVGIKLAHALNYEFLDTDYYIEEQNGKSISDIFAMDGEDAFRTIETKSLETLCHSLKHTILATGGGMPLRQVNADLLKKIGTVIYLKASEEATYERLKDDTTRPLLAGEHPREKISELLNQRMPIYEAVADHVISTDNRSFYSIIEEIQKKIVR